MKRIILLVLVLTMTLFGFSQKLDGQWKGYFNSKGDIVLSGSNTTEYVLELEINGTTVTGYSYSYFQNRRYYVICSLEGSYFKNGKNIEVTETARIKGNTPPDFSDCLQTHYLTYQKEGKTEELVGRWETAPGQRNGCGTGKTTLIRRTISQDLSSFNKPKDNTLSNAGIIDQKKTPTQIPNKNTIKEPTQKLPDLSDKNKNTTAIIEKPNSNTGIKKPVQKNNSTYNPNKQNNPITAKPPNQNNSNKLPVFPETKDNLNNGNFKSTNPDITKPIDTNKEKKEIVFEKRNNDLLKTIEITQEIFKVDLYDNGEVDGDSVSVFYNGKLILSRQRLSDKPISITLDANTGKEINQLTMYAENLGEIPPNTALMVVTDGDKRYEARIASDLKKSGTIHFVYKPKAQ